MRIENLTKCNLMDLGVTEIKCSKIFYNNLTNYSGTRFLENNTITYNNVPVSIDETILIDDECNLVYPRSQIYDLNITEKSIDIAKFLGDKFPKIFEFKSGCCFASNKPYNNLYVTL